MIKLYNKNVVENIMLETGEIVESIGKILKQARLEKGLTVEDLQQATKIQKKHLLAIENDDFEELPSSYYARTFIKQYATEVDEDGLALIRLFEGKTQIVQKNITPMSASRAKNHNQKNQSDKYHLVQENLPLIVLFSAALAIILLVAFFTLKDPGERAILNEPKEIKTETTVESESEKTETSGSETETSESDSEASETETEAVENDEKLTVSYLGSNEYDSQFEINDVKNDIEIELEAVNSPCWFGLQGDGKDLHDETLQPGKKYIYKFKDKPTDISVVVGDVSNMKMKMNNQAVNYNPENAVAITKNANFTISYK